MPAGRLLVQSVDDHRPRCEITSKVNFRFVRSRCGLGRATLTSHPHTILGKQLENGVERLEMYTFFKITIYINYIDDKQKNASIFCDLREFWKRGKKDDK